jgi:hypothetical protein
MVAALVLVAVLFALSDPQRDNLPAQLGAAVAPAPSFHGPPTVDAAGILADTTIFTPRIYLDPQTSVGMAPTPDSRSLRLLLRNASKTVELRRIPLGQNPQFDGFTVDGDTVVWAETLASSDTTLWRANWHTLSKPVEIIDDAGNPTFAGSQYDMVVNGGRVYWTIQASGSTDVRSVDLDGNDPQTKRLSGAYTLTQWPWAVSRGGRGTPVKLLDLTTNHTASVATTAQQNATCTPSWCRLDTLGVSGLTRIDIEATDGSPASQVAGPSATPAITDAVVLDRYVPLIVDRTSGTGLSLFDVTTGQSTLIAVNVDNVRAWGGLLWWSTTSENGVEWHALDVHTLS